MTFSVWKELINSWNKSFTSKLSTLSGPKDSSTNSVIEMKGRTVFQRLEVFMRNVAAAPCIALEPDRRSADTRSQVGQLTSEVQLQAELAAARGQSTPTSAGAQNAPAVTLILKDGRRIEAAGYALVGSTFWILNAQDATKISLPDVDVDATQKENQKRGIHVVIPTNTSQRRLR